MKQLLTRAKGLVAKATVLFAAAFLCSCAPSIKDLNASKSMDFPSLYEELEKADVIIIGEKHDIKKHHAWEKELVSNLLQSRPGLCVLLEMLPEKGEIKQELEDSQMALGWNKRWSWEQYKELAIFLHKNATCLGGLALSKEELNTIKEGAQPLSGNLSTSKEVKEGIKELIEKAHGKSMKPDEKMLSYFVDAQLFKDRRAADLALQKRPSLLIVGRVHADKSLGIPLHIQDYLDEKGEKLVVKSLLLGDASSSQADFVIK